MFNIGFTEMVAIGVIALIVIGPKQLPEVAKVVGRLLGELKKATQDLSGGLLEVTRDVKSSIDDTKAEIMHEGQKVMDSITNMDEPQDNYEEPLHEEEAIQPGDSEKSDGKS